jgi:hypothetical protein
MGIVNISRWKFKGLYQLFQTIDVDSNMYEGYLESNLRWSVNKTIKEKNLLYTKTYACT